MCVAMCPKSRAGEVLPKLVPGTGNPIRRQGRALTGSHPLNHESSVGVS